MIWSGVVTVAAMHSYKGLANIVETSVCVSTGVIIGSASLQGLGFAAHAGAAAVIARFGTIPGAGWIVAGVIGTYGIVKYKKAKKQEQEKERLKREIIKQQQAAIKR